MAHYASPALRRALLYVPASSHKMLNKSLGLNVDCVAYDLEDSVSFNKKDEARNNLREFLKQPKPPRIREQAVRINAVGSGMAEEDLEMVCTSAPHISTIVIPKVSSSSDLHFVTDYIHHHRRSPPQANAAPSRISLLALIESARAVTDLSSICAATPHLSGLIFAAEDFALDLSITRTPGLLEFLYARSAIVTAARARGLNSVIDLVCTDLERGGAAATAQQDRAQTDGHEEVEGKEVEEGKGDSVLEWECWDGKKLGFNGKQVIHPSQVGVAQRVFAPTREEVEWASRVLEGVGREDGKGAFVIDGRMVDKPVISKAERVLELARVCGEYG